jgi:lipid-binding SYLF domain-containing protein
MERGHSGSGQDGRLLQYVAGVIRVSTWREIKTVYLVFLDEGALKRFRDSEGWKAGVDGSVSLITLGAGGTIDTNNLKDPIVAFVLGQKGLMYNLSLEGTKFTKQHKK